MICRALHVMSELQCYQTLCSVCCSYAVLCYIQSLTLAWIECQDGHPDKKNLVCRYCLVCLMDILFCKHT